MTILKITSKRQVTLPINLCGDLGIQPGDQITVEQIEIDGKKVWTIQKLENDDEWFGSLSNYASNKSDKIKDIRKSITKGRYRPRSLY